MEISPVIFGTSSLGNLYQEVDKTVKKAIIEECIAASPNPTIFDTAGKYGAGLALKVLGQCLKELNVDPNRVVISNKLGWFQTALEDSEPTFEPGVWVNLNHDAVQKISYNGILACFDQGNQLLGKYSAQMVSVHDPDEYLKAVEETPGKQQRYQDILDAYRALSELKEKGKVASVGIGSKDWKMIERIHRDVRLDWVMIANSLTVHSHPQDLVSFIEKLNNDGVTVINSAVFNGGFLIGSDYYNYQKVNTNPTKGNDLYLWRYKFYKICNKFDVEPAQACVDFGFNIPGVSAIALNTTKPEKIKNNLAMVHHKIPQGFWQAMHKAKLITLPIEFLTK